MSNDKQIVDITIRIENNIKQLISHLEKYLSSNSSQKAKETAANVKRYCEDLKRALTKIKNPTLRELAKVESSYLDKIEQITNDMITHSNHLLRDTELIENIQKLLDQINQKEIEELRQPA